jgi:hypothetical protein
LALKDVIHCGIEGPSPEISEEAKNARNAVILEDLQNVLKSRFFRNSERGKQFLTYVVQNCLAGRIDLLKERVIGAEVFGRPPDYSTGEDPVVRVQAGEVRRRLEQYYHLESVGIRVHIELPTGSYSPTFRWLEETKDAVSVQPPAPALPQFEPEPAPASPPRTRTLLPWILAAAGLTSALILGAYVLWPGLFRQRSELDRFWAPGFASSEPILICVSEPVVYMPTPQFFDKYAAGHQGQFRSMLQRMNEVLPLKPDEKLEWKDIYPVGDLGLAMGDVYATVQLTTFLDRQGRKSQLRIGRNYTFEDLRRSPSVLIGAYNNKWTMQLTSNLRFRFQNDDAGDRHIYDTMPRGPHWRQTRNEQSQVVHDFGLVTRLLDSKTGQFTITIGGIAAVGTQASADLVSNPDYFREALQGAPKDWERKNMEIVLETTVTDAIASPPHVVATYFW